MTALTDALLAFLGMGFACALLQSEHPVPWGKRLWAWALAIQGVGALLGGLYHGFGPHWPPVWTAWLWQAVLMALSVGTALLVVGIAFLAVNRFAGRVIIAGVMGGKVLAYAAWISTRDDFLPALCDQGATMMCLLFLSCMGRKAESLRPWIVGGIILTFGGDAVQAFKLAPCPGFNHNDLYHVIGAGALTCFYRAGLLMKS